MISPLTGVWKVQPPFLKKGASQDFPSFHAEMSEPKFAVDVNVGRLAKWLRILGYDALFVPDVDDGGLVQIAQREGRIILTKDSRLLERRLFTSGQLKGVQVRGDHFIEQIRQVVTDLGLDTTKEFSRCIDCNTPLLDIGREDVKDIVPPYVCRTQEKFKRCPASTPCALPVTHWQNMKRDLAAALDGVP